MIKVAVAGADDPSSRSAKEGVAGLLGMEGKEIVSQLGTALGGLISCELELKGAPCEIAPMEAAAEREAPAAELQGGAAEVQSARRGSVRNFIPAAEATPLFGNQPVPRLAL